MRKHGSLGPEGVAMLVTHLVSGKVIIDKKRLPLNSWKDSLWTFYRLQGRKITRNRKPAS